ncbi:TauD/TfdA family dioxygenase [Streptomyces oryzae]|uniref:TauD/TfdA family dioxygenase n=1 Tax=Streptomyces oryzae TaxID=1434886 RepID=A0ABS3XAC0_9ACTN|nr:TauD/TfdA family dioxygenase [Streptomyces oryzae]MBO8192286.1 TauD/TfdA family dioxygenase [Streptomyces oryzae]
MDQSSDTAAPDGIADAWRFGVLGGEAVLDAGDEDLAEFERAAYRIADSHAGSRLDDPQLLAAAAVASRFLPAFLLEQLIRFRVTGNEAGTLLLRNLPVETPLPPTPGDGRFPDHWSALPLSTLTQLAVMSVLGDAISYADEKEGRLVQDICPLPGAEERQENSGSVLLDLHTEDSFHPYRPDYLSLYCLRSGPDRNAITVTGSIRAALPLLSPLCAATLREPVYRTRFSSSFGDAAAPRHTSPRPVLSGPADDPDLCVNFFGTEAVDERGTVALDELRGAVEKVLCGVLLQPGDLILIDNRTAVHGRTGFTPGYDGQDRWLRRCFAAADLRPSRALRKRDSRVCAPIR